MKYSMAGAYFPENEIAWILGNFKSILEGKEMLSMGRFVKEFEKEFALYVGSRFAVGTSSCSAALEIALRSIPLRPGDEVIVPAETFIATGSSVLREGGEPVFAEVDPGTFCLSLDTVRKCATSRTRAVIIVHMGGLVSPSVFEIRRFCDEQGIVLIEDAAHAIGASIENTMAGNLGHVGCFSFYPTKTITTAEGGMLTTSDENIFRKADSYRSRGRDLDAPAEKYDKLGTNNRMTELAALMGLSQLRCVDGFIKKRNRIAAIYGAVIQASDVASLFKIPLVPRNSVHAYWRYTVSLDPRINREELKRLMGADGIPMDWAYYPPLHLQPLFVDLYGNKPGMLPVSEELLEHNVCLPMHVQIEPADAELIAERFAGNVRTLAESCGIHG